LGDLGHIPGKAVLSQLEGVDALLIPVGGHFTIDAAAACKLVQRLSPRVVIPMHYRLGDMGYPVIHQLHEFTDLCTNVVHYDTNVLELTANTPPQTAVLQYSHG
jgi:L-ascorbate metabolism protein UlaG (beta-lactamase superfamily)